MLYLDWLHAANVESGGQADLVAFFFRLAFALLRQSGCLGLLATNTIAQGDTRESGLTWICEHGGGIYYARKRVPWPGMASVSVSIICIRRSERQWCCELDERKTEKISAYLFDKGGNRSPAKLMASQYAFLGCMIGGVGFTFDDDLAGATPVNEMHRIISADPKNQLRIRPFGGGEEVNSTPALKPRRYVIDFDNLDEQTARMWPDLLSIIENKVRPERERSTRDTYRKNWWHFGEKRPDLRKSVSGLTRMLVIALVSKHHALRFAPTSFVFSHNVGIIALDAFSCFAVLQSSVHALFAAFFSSTLEDRQAYRPSDAFETFPFPEEWRTSTTLEDIGKRYYEYRAALMVRDESDQFGLTELYNRFHDPQNEDEGIAQLRTLHEEMDRAVLDAYGWKELAPKYAFIDEQGEDEDDEGGAGARSKKRSVRCRWPDEFRDEVLARLIALNAERAAAEAEVRRLKEEEAAKAKAAEKAAKALKKQ